MDKLSTQKGFSIIELLIAMAIAIIVMSGVVAGSGGFAATLGGYQSTISDSEINAEALHKAQDLIEQAAATARTNYTGVTETSVTDISSGLSYTKKLTIPSEYVTQCAQAVVGTISWAGTYGRQLWAGATTTIVNIPEMIALGGDCDFTLPTEWDNPDSLSSDPLGGAGATDLDADGDFIYLTSDPSPVGTEDLYVFEFDPSAPLVADKLVLIGDLNVSAGLNAVDVAGDYAYVANASSTNNSSSRELLVIDISDPANPTEVGSATLGIAPSCPGTYCPGGALAVHYNNGRVYIGTHRIGGDEFYIYDVSSPSNPTLIRSLEIDHNINDIVVRGDYAFLATSDNSGELHIYDISDPGPITFVASFNANRTLTDFEDGLRLFLLGDTLYLAREGVNLASEREFYMIDVSNPASPTELGSKNLNLNNNTEIAGVAVRGRLAFVAIDDPNTGLQILNISDPSSIVNHTTCTSLNFSENTTGIDMSGNFIFTANDSNDEIRVIQDQPTMCSP